MSLLREISASRSRPLTQIPAAKRSKFMRRASVLIILGTFAIVIAGCEADAVLVTPRPDTTLTEGSTGVTLYRYHCSGCHGIDGVPLVDASEDLRDYSQSFQTFDSILKDGPGLMPRFAHLNVQKRQLIYDHTRTLRR